MSRTSNPKGFQLQTRDRGHPQGQILVSTLTCIFPNSPTSINAHVAAQVSGH
jgi:hypothetical protein